MKKVFIIIGGLLALCIIVVVVLVATSKKMVCKSNEGNITITYNNTTITGYSANGIDFDLDGQKEIAEQIGVDAYLNQFANWFSTNTTGTCTR